MGWSGSLGASNNDLPNCSSGGIEAGVTEVPLSDAAGVIDQSLVANLLSA